MAYNCEYYYPVNNQTPNYVTTQYDPQSYYYWQQCYYNAYQNQLRKLQKRQITMEYWTRQLEYFRNLLKNFSAVIETPDDLKKLLETCNYDENIKKCFEKRRTFYNTDKNNCNCFCSVCLKKTLMRLYKDFSAPCNKCYCSACRQKPCRTRSGAHQCQTPSAPCYYYVPCQMPAACSYYTCQQPAASPTCCTCQQMPHDCDPTNCNIFCNKCKFKDILDKINWILSSAEQLKCTCSCRCACASDTPVIQEIIEEKITRIPESVVETDADKNKAGAEAKENNLNCSHKVTFNLECECGNESNQKQKSNLKSRKHSESTNDHSNFSGAETIDDASNISEEGRNDDLSVKKKQASIALGEEYISPSGRFEVQIQDQNNKENKQNADYVFQVDYATYTKTK